MCYRQAVPIGDRVAAVLADLPSSPQYPTQGATVFVDLELYRLLDERLISERTWERVKRDERVGAGPTRT